MVERVSMRAGSGLADSVEDDSMQVLGQRLDVDVRWVTVPENLGGGRANVVAHQFGDCPCREGHRVNSLVLDRMHEGKRLVVAECGARFVWTVL